MHLHMGKTVTERFHAENFDFLPTELLFAMLDVYICGIVDRC